MKKQAGDLSTAIDEADVPMQVRRDAGMFGPEGDDFGPRYIIAGGKAYRRRQGIWQGKRDYKPSAPGQWYVEDAPEDGLARGAPGLEEPAPLKMTEQAAMEKSKAIANEKAAVAEERDAKEAANRRNLQRHDEVVDRRTQNPEVKLLSKEDATAQAKAQAASNKLEPAHKK